MVFVGWMELLFQCLQEISNYIELIVDAILAINIKIPLYQPALKLYSKLLKIYIGFWAQSL